jgi:hypothetical protein
MKKIKAIYRNYQVNVLLTDPKIRDDTDHDHNKVAQQLLIGYILKITKIVIDVVNFSYLLGMFWYIMIKLIEDFGELNYKDAMFDISDDDMPFIPYYGLQKKTNY